MLSLLAAGDEPKSILADVGFTALLYFAAAVAFLLAGSGRFGLDFLVRRRRKDEAPQ